MRLTEEQARRICEARGTLETLLSARVRYVDKLDALVRDIEAVDASADDVIRDLMIYLMQEDDDDTHGA